MTTGDTASPFPAAQRWADQLGGWGIPHEIADQAFELPWFHDPQRFTVDDALDRDSTSARWARAAASADNPPPFVDEVATVRWPGMAESVV